MPDHNEFKERIFHTTRFRKLVELRREIERSKGTMPFSIYAELLNRAEEKIKTFDYPMCGTVDITLLFSNGLKMKMEPKECFSALKSDTPLSTYIFNNYPSATDFNIDLSDVSGIMNKETPVPQEKPEEPVSEEKPSGTEQVQNIKEQVNNLSEKVDRMEKTFTEELPKLSKRMDDIEIKMEFLYRKVTEQKK